MVIIEESLFVPVICYVTLRWRYNIVLSAARAARVDGSASRDYVYYHAIAIRASYVTPRERS